jgi:hypothetical protein
MSFWAKRMAAIPDAVMKATTSLSETAAAIASFSSSVGALPSAASPQMGVIEFEHLGRHLRVVCDDVWAARLLERAFVPMRCTGAARNDVARIERDCDTILLRFDSSVLRFSKRKLGSFGAAFSAVRELFARFASSSGNATALYGGSAALNGAGVAMFGVTGAGKTVLLLHLARLGMRFLGDETLVVDWDAQKLAAQPRLPALREPALSMLPSDMREAIVRCPNVVRLTGGRFWYAVPRDYLSGIAPDATPQELRAIIALRDRQPKPSIVPLSAQESLRLITAHSYFKPRSLQEVARIRRSLANIPAFAVHVAEPAETAKLLMETLACA